MDDQNIPFGADDSELEDQNVPDPDIEEEPDEDASDADPDGSADDGEFDVQAALEDLRTGVMSKSDFEAFRTDLNRKLGQIPAFQSELAKIKKSQVDPELVSTDSETLGALIAALPSVIDMSDPAFSKLTELQQRRAQAQATRDAIARVREEMGTPEPSGNDTGNTMSPEDASAWNTASGLVNGYAKAKGIDPSSIEPETWRKAVADSSGIPDRAAENMYKVIDAMAESTSGRQNERRTRKAAGNAGTPANNGGSGGGGSALTIAKLSAMTTEQIMKLDPKEVDRVIAAAGA